MSNAAFTVDSKKNDYPILIIDKLGILGEELAKKLNGESLVFFVSKKNIEIENVVNIPFLKTIPTIPENTYSHIIIIDEYLEIPNTLINTFVKKAKHDNSSLTLVININRANKEEIHKYISLHEKFKIILTGDIFANNIFYDSTSWINIFIKQAQQEGVIKIPGEGSDFNTPVFIEDVVFNVLQIALIENEKERIFFVFPKHRQTLLSIAHTFQKIEPNIKIDFTKETKKQINYRTVDLDGKYILGETYNLYDALKKINLSSKKTQEVERETYLDKIPSQNKSSYLFFGVILTIIFFLLLPVFSTLCFTGLGAYFINNFKNDMIKENFSQAKNNIVLSYNFFLFSKTSFSLLEKEANFIGQGERLDELSEKINGGLEISKASFVLLESLDKIKNLLSGQEIQTESFLKTTDDFKNALVVYQKEKHLGKIPSSIDDGFSDIINFAATTIDYWPQFLGFDKTKNYLVLFQDSMELRPGGGFIDSYGLLTLNNGRVVRFSINDVYGADGQLKQHMEPPFAIRRYLPSVNWYLRDSNFNPDFSQNAISARVFLKAETAEFVDGVIGVDLEFVKNLLSATGPVEVLNYKQVINKDNFYEAIQRETQKKKDYLRTLLNSISLKISQDKETSYLNLLQSFAKSLSEKHVAFEFNDTNLQTVFALNNWGGVILDNRKASDTKINDSLGLVEANLGTNKVNYYISRGVYHFVNLTNEGKVSQTLTISYKNKAPKTLGKQGVYKNYLKVILPKGTIIQKINIDGKEQKLVDAVVDPTVYEKKGFIPPSGLELEKTDSGTNTAFGFLTIIDAQSSKTITLNYDLPNKVNLVKSGFTYDLKLFKQLGIDMYPYNLSLTLPDNLQAISLPTSFTTEDNKVNYKSVVKKDEEIIINLSKM